MKAAPMGLSDKLLQEGFYLSRINISVDEADIGDVRQNQEVEFTVDAFPDRDFRGVVSQRGNLIPVFDLAEWAGYPADSSRNSQIVAIGLGTHSCALRCNDAPTLLNVAEDVDGDPAPTAVPGVG